MKAGGGNIYYLLETVALLSSISFIIYRHHQENRKNRTVRKAALRTMSEENRNMEFEPHLQSGNCIVAATCNILWYHGQHGYPELIRGIGFPELEKRIDGIINSKGGYANNNVPETVEEYVRTYTSYEVEVKNHWYPEFSDLVEAAASRPCLLGFARGSVAYGSSAGHMTACVWAAESDGKQMVGVMDGHKTHVVYWEWSKYNDFISEFIFSKASSDSADG